jgi:hypothetical protein
MLLGSIALTEPGFGRLWLSVLTELWGDGYVASYFSAYIGTLALVLAMGIYDLTTRRRLHRVYAAAACWIVVNQAVATWLFHQAFWLAWMKSMTGHGG